MKIAIVFGSTTRYTEMVADKIASQPGFENADLIDVEDINFASLSDYDLIIFGIPTWDYGELQSSWQEVWDELDKLDFSGQLCAFYGLGDQSGYARWFVDAMGILHDKIAAKGAIVIGEWSTAGYQFDSDKALTKDKKNFVGLAIDDVNQQVLTDERIARWCSHLNSLISATNKFERPDGKNKHCRDR